MSIGWWILLIVALIIIGVFAVVRFVLRQGHSAYQKGKNAVNNRRNRRMQNTG